MPYYIWTRRYRYGFSQRMGILPEKVQTACLNKRVIWIHGVSVGEIKTASILAPLLRKSFPSHMLVFSTVTHTGNSVACTIAGGNEQVIYLPIDLSFVVDKVVKAIKPEMFFVLETELWPNLISSLNKLGAKIILVNGRISQRSYNNYKRAGYFISKLFKKFSLVLMQSEQDAVRALALGAEKEKVFVTGNLKFDLSLMDFENKRDDIRKKLGINEDEVLFIAGSTHKPEEEVIVETFLRLSKEFSRLKLLIAPRHIERIPEIEGILARKRLGSRRISSFSINYKPSAINNQAVFLLDTIGELRSIYSAGDVVFVGGSLTAKGGQNPIEPASYSKPVIIGKWTFNFQDVVKAFIDNGGIIQVEDSEGLYTASKKLIGDDKERKRIGANAKDTINKNSGSSKRSMDIILEKMVTKSY